MLEIVNVLVMVGIGCQAVSPLQPFSIGIGKHRTIDQSQIQKTIRHPVERQRHHMGCNQPTALEGLYGTITGIVDNVRLGRDMSLIGIIRQDAAIRSRQKERRQIVDILLILVLACHQLAKRRGRHIGGTRHAFQYVGVIIPVSSGKLFCQAPIQIFRVHGPVETLRHQPVGGIATTGNR